MRVYRALPSSLELIRRIRWIGVVLMSGTLILLLVGGSYVHAALVGVMGLLLAGWIVFARQIDRLPSPVRVNLGIGALMQLAAVGLTGGLSSPLLPVLIPMAIFSGMTLRRAQHLAVQTAPVVLAVLCFGVADGLLGAHAYVPKALNVHVWPLGAIAGTVVLTAVMMMATGVGARLGFDQRVRLDTAQLELAQSHARTVSDLEERQLELAALSGTLAHELKNPLAAIQALTTLMHRRAEPGSADGEQLQVVVAEVQRMGAILDEFLSFSRPLSSLRLHDVALHDLVADVLVLYGPASQELDVRLQRAGRAECRCDGSKVRQIVLNLVRNALDASPPGGAIWVRVDQDADWAILEVRDSGEGPEPGAHVFSSGYSSKATGSGLGLPIARTLARQHGGELTLMVDDEQTVARLTLPLVRQTNDPEIS